MPNYVKTRIYAKYETIEEIKKIALVKEKDDRWEDREHFDFRKIIPMPRHIFRWNLSTEDEKKHWRNNCWYEWCCFNWWTKWNACEYNEWDDFIEIETAWSCPLQIIRELSKIFPDEELVIEYADEDRLSNCWKFKIKDCEIEECDIWNPRKFAEKMWWTYYDE